MQAEDAVAAAFRDQATWCERLGSPLTARICASLAEPMRDTAVGRHIAGWPGDPSPKAASLPLRVCGALHHLVRTGRDPDLAAFYTGERPFEAAAFRQAAAGAFGRFADVVQGYLASAPQTNEVGRSVAVMAGLLEIARRFPQPIALYEIGSSAGLNQVPDRFAYRFGDAACGTGTRLVLAPDWRGPPPPVDARVDIASRRGVDLSPIDLRAEGARERLLSYVWPDQRERLSRLEAAIELALEAGVGVEQGDAAPWIAAQLARPAAPGTTRVLVHTIVWSYLAPETRVSIETTLARAAAAATAATPLAWLRYELEGTKGARLRLSAWPAGEEFLLAEGHPHCTWMEYFGAPADR